VIDFSSFNGEPLLPELRHLCTNHLHSYFRGQKRKIGQSRCGTDLGHNPIPSGFMLWVAATPYALKTFFAGIAEQIAAQI
jgi:hypothetical protein